MSRCIHPPMRDDPTLADLLRAREFQTNLLSHLERIRALARRQAQKENLDDRLRLAKHHLGDIDAVIEAQIGQSVKP